ncbi:MAG TPA: hypothetical protein VGP07_23135, partial [Polyangia bacterium]
TGKVLGSTPRLSSASGAAFDEAGTLWALGTGAASGPAPEILPARQIPQVLDGYPPGPGRHMLLCMSCLAHPQLGVDVAGDLVVLAAVTAPFQFDGVKFPGDLVTGETWVLLQVHDGRLRAHHTLRTTRARLAVAGNGRVAIVATGVRAETSLDGQVKAARNESVLIQFQR